jgi:hypothetical protein
MAQAGGERILSRDVIREIYERSGLSNVLMRQREAAHLSGERVEDLSLRVGQQGELAAKRLAALTANDKSSVPMRVLISEQPGY